MEVLAAGHSFDAFELVAGGQEMVRVAAGFLAVDFWADLAGNIGRCFPERRYTKSDRGNWRAPVSCRTGGMARCDHFKCTGQRLPVGGFLIAGLAWADVDGRRAATGGASFLRRVVVDTGAIGLAGRLVGRHAIAPPGS